MALQDFQDSTLPVELFVNNSLLRSGSQRAAAPTVHFVHGSKGCGKTTFVNDAIAKIATATDNVLHLSTLEMTMKITRAHILVVDDTAFDHASQQQLMNLVHLTGELPLVAKSSNGDTFLVQLKTIFIVSQSNPWSQDKTFCDPVLALLQQNVCHVIDAQPRQPQLVNNTLFAPQPVPQLVSA